MQEKLIWCRKEVLVNKQKNSLNVAKFVLGTSFE